MSGRWARDRWMALSFALFSVALAFWQRPGWATAETKIDLHVDPGRFLSQVASAWTSTTDLGEVHSAQYSGYLWPMGPFFALFHALGIGAWVVERIWLATLFALATWGMLKLLDVLIGRPRGVAHVVATAFFLLNPYTVVFTARTSITLLGYVALPWLLLITYHGVRAPRGRRRFVGSWRAWWWASAFALVMTSTGGGVNAAVVFWMLVGPLVLIVYEPAVGNVSWGDAGGFLLRILALGLLASLWWIVPVLVHVSYGINFLQFTEQPMTIWGTNSITESLRLMGYWTSYVALGFGLAKPFFSDGGTMLFNPLVVGASLLLPAFAIAAFVRARRHHHGPFLVALIVVGLLIETAGFPNGTPIRGTMVWIYDNIFVLSFLRTTNKAAPLVAVGVAGLLGIGFAAALAWLRTPDRSKVGPPRWLRPPAIRRAALFALPVALAAVIVLASLPLIRGDAIDTQLEYKKIPSAWTDAGHGLDRTLPANTRAIVLPGQDFAYYNWGGTLDAILPRLTSRPVAVRYETPYADLHSVDMLDTIDDLVQQNRLLPGELGPLLRLIGVGAVVTGADDDVARSGAIDARKAALILAGQGLGKPSVAYGPVKSHPATGGDIGSAVSLPEVRRYDIADSRGIVHIDPVADPTVVDGSAETLANMAAFGQLPATAPIFYAADQTEARLRSLSQTGANLVVGDSNRREEFLPQSTQQNAGPVLTANASFGTGAPVVNPFPAAGTDGQTVAALDGASSFQTPTLPGDLQFPEAAPIAAFDGNLQTAWAADRLLPVSDRWFQVNFDTPRNVPYVDVYPLDDSHGVVTSVNVNGIEHAVGSGWTRIPLHLRDVGALRFTITGLLKPKVGDADAGGFREIRIPGVHIRQWLRAPLLVGRDLAGANLSHDSLTYMFERTTGDEPFERDPYGADTLLATWLDRGDAEQQIQRIVFAPTTRSYLASAWVYPAVGAQDSALDRLAGYRGADTFDSSTRYQDQPAYRASSAFEPGSRTGWIGVWPPADAPLPWIGWSTPRPLRVSQIRLTPSPIAVRHPTVVRVSWPGGATAPLRLGADDVISLPQAVAARTFRITILAAAFPAGATANERQSEAVGIGSISVPGLSAPKVPSAGPLHAGCGTVAIDVQGRTIPLTVSGTVAQLDAGRPLRARQCGSAFVMAAGVEHISSLPGTFSVDLLSLRSAAPDPVATAAATGTVVRPGQIGNDSVTGVRVALQQPSWLVLGESYDAGWRASCNGLSLGPSRVIDGYANGWLAPTSCREVAFTFAPQGEVNDSYVISAVAAVLMLILLLWGARRSPAAATAEAPARAMAPWRGGPRPVPVAAALALLAAIPLAYVFALRAGAALFLILTFVLWRGFRPRTLILVAAGMLGVAVPIAYAFTHYRNQGGYDFGYSTQAIWAHWIGVAAIVLLALACLATIRATRRSRPMPEGHPPVSGLPDAGAARPRRWLPGPIRRPTRSR